MNRFDVNKRLEVYSVFLEEDTDYDGSVWSWHLYLSDDWISWGKDAAEVAQGVNSYRWTAVRAAKKAARRHAAGKTPVRGQEPKPVVLTYPVWVKR